MATLNVIVKMLSQVIELHIVFKMMQWIVQKFIWFQYLNWSHCSKRFQEIPENPCLQNQGIFPPPLPLLRPPHTGYLQWVTLTALVCMLLANISASSILYAAYFLLNPMGQKHADWRCIKINRIELENLEKTHTAFTLAEPGQDLSPKPGGVRQGHRGNSSTVTSVDVTQRLSSEKLSAVHQED